MLTYPATAPIARDDRPAYRPYAARVTAIRQLTPHFVRVTFTGDEFDTFGTDGLDQRIKIVFPLPQIGISDLGDDGDWYARWRELPHDARNPFRTYTIRGIRPELRELDVDFVAHGASADGTTGPAAKWLLDASVGDELVIVGPDARSIHSAVGIDWHPGTATQLLLVGDETAAPAITAILEQLGPDVTARAFVEVPTADDVLPTAGNVTWLFRDSGDGLESAVRAWAAAEPQVLASAKAAQRQELEEIDVDREMLWDSPEDSPGEFYAWLAGESATIKTLRRFLVSETGIDRKRVAFMGYWRLGKSEAQE